MLIDSNLIIYASKPEHEFLRHWFASDVPAFHDIRDVEAVYKIVQENSR